MFTGLVRALGRIAQVTSGEQARTFTVHSGLPLEDLDLGASVAVSGVCLTVTSAGRIDDATTGFVAQAAFETLQRTTLAALGEGDVVNLEPALRVGDALGGHFVSGHVDGVGQVRTLEDRGDARRVEFDVPPSLLPFVAVKGSIAVDGVSLTINEVDAKGFAVGLIPHTLDVTTLGRLESGKAVNLEVDVVARYVARLHETRSTTGSGA